MSRVIQIEEADADKTLLWLDGFNAFLRTVFAKEEQWQDAPASYARDAEIRAALARVEEARKMHLYDPWLSRAADPEEISETLEHLEDFQNRLRDLLPW